MTAHLVGMTLPIQLPLPHLITLDGATSSATATAWHVSPCATGFMASSRKLIE